VSVTAETVLVTARSLLNDDAASLFTDTVLFPKLTQAHRELQAILRAHDCAVMKKSFVSAVLVNTGVLTTVPPDLLEPLSIQEKVSGAAFSTYAPMSEQDPLDPTGAGTSATASQFWQWNDEVLNFRAPTANGIDVNIFYWRQITIPAVSTDLIGILFGELYLAPRTAALMAGSLGDSETYKIATDIALKSIDSIISANSGRVQNTLRP